MTKDLLRNTAIAHALVALMTAHGADLSDVHVKLGFAAVINAMGEGVEKASQVEGDAQIALLEEMRTHAADLFEAGDDEARTAAGEHLNASFASFAETIPGYGA